MRYIFVYTLPDNYTSIYNDRLNLLFALIYFT